MNKILSLLFDFEFIFFIFPGRGILKDMVKVGGLKRLLDDKWVDQLREKNQQEMSFIGPLLLNQF